MRPCSGSHGGLSRLTLDEHPAIFAGAGDTALVPARDLAVSDLAGLPEVLLAGGAAPVGPGAPGVLVFLEATSADETLRVLKRGPDLVVLPGW